MAHVSHRDASFDQSPYPSFEKTANATCGWLLQAKNMSPGSHVMPPLGSFRICSTVTAMKDSEGQTPMVGLKWWG